MLYQNQATEQRDSEEQKRDEEVYFMWQALFCVYNDEDEEDGMGRYSLIN